jgi:hypothetical protein
MFMVIRINQRHLQLAFMTGESSRQTNLIGLIYKNNLLKIIGPSGMVEKLFTNLKILSFSENEWS